MTTVLGKVKVARKVIGEIMHHEDTWLMMEKKTMIIPRKNMTKVVKHTWELIHPVTTDGNPGEKLQPGIMTGMIGARKMRQQMCMRG